MNKKPLVDFFAFGLYNDFIIFKRGNSMYENKKCEYCGEQFAKNDDVVVCPDCGAPYHRKCWNEHGECAHSSEHASGYAFNSASNPEQEETINFISGEEEDFVQKIKEQIVQRAPEQGDSAHCENCGAELIKGDNYCVYCGHKQGDPIKNGKRKFDGRDPLGGMNPDDEIAGEKVSNLVLLIRRNSDKLLPKLKAVSERKVKIGWSWLAFFFGYFYLFFRKLYKYGMIVILAQIMLFNVANIALGDPVKQINDTISSSFNTELSGEQLSDEEYFKAYEGAAKEVVENGSLMRIYAVAGISVFCTNLACALLFHFLYLMHCKGTIARMNKSAEILGEMSASDFRLNLLARGGVSIFGILLGYFSNMLLGQIVSYIIQMFTK